ncbi:ribulose-phosphate 3-epimerase [Pirellula staleyi DSM 6068]|uniref:Ribulose-phosphate 3-epimerase n=1 Tax=Pirellula staleyi (strain ATCC 27377 / DSM 6068 / ICPB 4128) TaxID=530564 RepID=D2QWZ1_PIRSD|nr:ribulose-phosphate 3-epimerase [Pirellula staleyi]ADB16095.1 ribulose-phosphate 3-epimerase [Pirellula staleyi DSM 6068]
MTRRLCLETWQHAGPVVLPSLLLCDFGNLEREVRRLEEAGVKALHLDVMDGVFVPNLTYGMPIVEGLRRLTDMPLDVHLMIQRPEKYLRQFHSAGADVLTVHIEAVEDAQAILGQIRDLDMGAGIAINPSTPMTRFEAALPYADLALVMSVEAGFGGQSFHEIALERMAHVRRVAQKNLLIEVDGGINTKTIARASSAGATLFVVGSAIFGQSDYGTAVSELSALAKGV